MSYQNKGNQHILCKFRTPLDSDYISKSFQYVFSTGIYSGFEVSKIDNITVNINSGKAVISDGIYTTVIETLENIDNQAVSPLIPYIVMRWNYLDTVSWYADFTAVSFSGIREHDLVLAKVIYNNSNEITSVNNLIKTEPDKLRFEEINNNLKVVMRSTPTMGVTVLPGFLFGMDGTKHDFVQTNVNIDDGDVSNPRIDLVVIDGNNQINVLKGTAASTPQAPNSRGMFVLAEILVNPGISLGAGNAIYIENIIDDRSFFTPIFQLGQIIVGLDEKVSIASNDLFVIADSENVFNQKKIKYDTIKNQTNIDAKNYIQSNTTQSTSKDTGALVLEGGLGVEKNINAGGSGNINGNLSAGGELSITGSGEFDGDLIAHGDLITDNDLYCLNGLISGTSQSTSKNTGALVLEGGLGVEKNINGGGNLYISGFIDSIGGIVGFSGDGSSSCRFQTAFIDIGDWNMSVDAGGSRSKNITVGDIPNFAYGNIRSLSVIIRDNYSPVNSMESYCNVPGNFQVSIDLGNSRISLGHNDDSKFNHAQYSATGFNRGWVKIDFILP